MDIVRFALADSNTTKIQIVVDVALTKLLWVQIYVRPVIPIKQLKTTFVNAICPSSAILSLKNVKKAVPLPRSSYLGSV